MKNKIFFSIAAIAIIVVIFVILSPSVLAQQALTPPPVRQILKVETTEIPKVPIHEGRVYSVVLAPGEIGAWHTHASPPFVYVVEGALIVDVEGKPSEEVPAGKAVMEPPLTVMRARNTSTTNPAKLVVFQISDPSKPFLDEVKR